MCALPAVGAAKPVGQFEFVVAEADDQVDPSIDGQFIVYAGPGDDGVDVFLYDIGQGAKQIIGGGAGIQDAPDVYSSTAIYRSSAEPAGIFIETWTTGLVRRQPPPGGDGLVSNPVIHQSVAAWEQQGQGGLDVVVTRHLASGAPYVLGAQGGVGPAGDQHAPAAFGDVVAYVDGGQQGSVWLHDSSKGPQNSTFICDGEASGVSVWSNGSECVVAVARSATGTDEDIEIYDATGTMLAALPAAGPQRNPHVAGDWVAFEDQSTGFSQVVVWRWNPRPEAGQAELAFLPHPSQTQQRLNDLSLALSDEVRVVFEDTQSAATGKDIALYRVPVNPLVDDGLPNDYPFPPPGEVARCADPNATVLAMLELERAAGKPRSRSVDFEAPPPAGEDDTPVLVCIEAERVSSAWVALDDDLIAPPSAFEPHTVELAIRSSVDDGHGRLSASLAGKPGAKLTIRVLADPGGDEGECVDDDDGDGEDDDDGDGEDDDDGDGEDDDDGDGEDDDDGDDDGDGDGDGGGVSLTGKHRGRCRGGSDRSDASPGGSVAPPEIRFGGGCGGAGGIGSLAALLLVLMRRRPRA